MKHEWFVPEGIGYECCKKCGFIRNATNGDKECRGAVRVTPRRAREGDDG